MQITKENISHIASSFINFYKDLGYEEISPMSIVQNQDKSITFTNATIVPLKEKLINGFDGKGYVVFQPCLRLTNLKQPKFNSVYTSYFRMVGILSSPNLSLSEQAKNINDYLTSFLSIKSNEITIHCNNETAKLASFFSKKYKFQSNALSPKSYRWNYGIKGVSGSGITFYIERGSISRELGNFVEIRNDTEIIGYEFGFGIETYYSIANQLANNFLVLFGSDQIRKINDLFIALCVASQSTRLKKDVNFFVKASVKKLKVELSYELYRNQFNSEDIKIIDESLFDISRETISEVQQDLNKRIKKLNKNEEKLINYESYLKESLKSGKSENWARNKMTEYVRKNNLFRLLESSLNKSVKNIQSNYKYDN